MWVTWTPLKTRWTGSSLPLTRFSYILSFQCFQTFFICYLNSWICVCTTSPRSPHLSQDGGGSIDVEEIRDIVVGLFRFATILLKLSSRLIWGFPLTKSFEYEPQTNYCSNTWNTKRQRAWFLFYADICIIHSNQACWDRRRWRPSHCLRLWCQVNQYVPWYLNYVPLY